MLPVVIPCLEEGICRDCPWCPTDKNAAQKDDFAARDSEEVEEQAATGDSNGFPIKLTAYRDWPLCCRQWSCGQGRDFC